MVRKTALVAKWLGVTSVQTGPAQNISELGGRTRCEFRLANVVDGSVTVDCEDSYDGTNFAQYQTSGAQTGTTIVRAQAQGTTKPAPCAPAVRGRITAITGTWDVEVWITSEGG